MPSMQTMQTSRSGVIEVVEVERPVTALTSAKWGARLISHRIPFTDVHHAFQLALTPGAAEKIIVAVGD
jgi:hypothetical protein